MFLSRDVIFKENVFPFKHWHPKLVSSSSSSSSHNVFPSQSHVLDSVPHILAEFSFPFTSDDTAVPPDEFLDLVHPNLAPSQPVLPP